MSAAPAPTDAAITGTHGLAVAAADAVLMLESSDSVPKGANRCGRRVGLGVRGTVRARRRATGPHLGTVAHDRRDLHIYALCYARQTS